MYLCGVDTFYGHRTRIEIHTLHSVNIGLIRGTRYTYMYIMYVHVCSCSENCALSLLNLPVVIGHVQLLRQRFLLSCEKI